MFKAIFLTATVAALTAVPFSQTPVFAADEYNTVPGLTAAGAPLGLHGIDPVALIKSGERVEGTAKYTSVHEGVAYYFTTQRNLTAFETNPAQYTPQNGGFCTYGVSVGAKFDGNPSYSDVVDGKLYVFLNEEIYNAYQQDPQGTIAKAEQNWTRIRSTPSEDLMPQGS